ncbi:2OG-Fe(II) oxygenase [Lentzea kentuckyensis]|uniref:2OG-Fe(II) oxygenase n=1 Tax=Lentzea kentuckyensis TaxID=360086 RepID=UPI000A3A7F81|nr:2OG-Fe(II) oxygenase [Lentzea kentuckyensis]
MLNLTNRLQERTTPFQLFHVLDVLSSDQLDKLVATAPTQHADPIVVDDPLHEKQYRMNLFRLVEGDEQVAPDTELPVPWQELRRDLMSPEFTSWLEEQTGIGLTGLLRSVGVYAHRNGDFLAVHKDKPTKAITTIIYLNQDWPAEAGGRFLMFETGERGAAPVAELPPVGGRLVAFPPTDHSWHAVSKIDHPDGTERLTVQIEYWLTTELMGSAYRGGTDAARP